LFTLSLSLARLVHALIAGSLSKFRDIIARDLEGRHIVNGADSPECR